MENEKRVFNLEPRDGRKSFYGKAKAIEDSKTVQLQSYQTIVAVYHKKSKKMDVHGWYSATTSRHINAFLLLYGFPPASKKELETWNTK